MAGKNNRKHGNNKASCLNYRLQNRRLRNKVRRIERHLKRQPQDAEASDALHRVKKLRDDYKVTEAKSPAKAAGGK